MAAEELIIVVRAYDARTDRAAAEAVDRMCDVGASGKVSLCMDQLGDPASRVRHSPAFLMLVAEARCGPVKEIVGVVRGSVKVVACGKKMPRHGGSGGGGGGGGGGTRVRELAAPSPIYTKEDGDWIEAGGADGGMVRGEGSGVRVHGDHQGQRGVARTLHRALRLLQVPDALHPRPPRLRPPPPRPQLRRRPHHPPRRRPRHLPPPLRRHRVLPPRHRRRPRQPPLRRHPPRRPLRLRRRRALARGGRLPDRPAGVLGHRQRLGLRRRLPDGGPRRVAAAPRGGGGDARGRPGDAVAEDPIGARSVPAVRRVVPVRDRGGGPGGGGDGGGRLEGGAQQGEGRGGRGRGGGRRGGASPRRDTAMAAVLRGGGRVVREEAGGRVQRWGGRRLEQVGARAQHIC